MKLIAARCHYWIDDGVLHGVIVDQDHNLHRGSWPVGDYPITPTQSFISRNGQLLGLGEFGELIADPDETEADIDAEIEEHAIAGCTTLVPTEQRHRPLQATSVHWIALAKYGLIAHVYDQNQRLISTRWQYADGTNIKPEDAKFEAKKLAEDFRRGSRFRLVKRRGHLVIEDRRIPLWQIEYLNRQNEDLPECNFRHERATLHTRIDDQSDVLFFSSGYSLRSAS